MLFEKKKKSDLTLKRSIFNKSSNKGITSKFYIKGAQLFKTTPQKFKRNFWIVTVLFILCAPCPCYIWWHGGEWPQ